MNRYILFIGTCFFLWSSCEKIQLPDPVINDPLFELSLNMGDTPLLLGGAGTAVTSGFDWDDLGVRVFSCSIKNKESEEELTIFLRDDRLSKKAIGGDTFELFRADTLDFANKYARAKNVKMLLNRLLDPSYSRLAKWQTSNKDHAGLNFNYQHPSGLGDQTICLYIEDQSTKCKTTFCKDRVGSSLQDFPLEGFVIEGNRISPKIGAGFNLPYKIRWDDLEQDMITVNQSRTYDLFIIDNSQRIFNVEIFLELDQQNRIKTPCFTGFSTELFTFQEDPMFNTAEIQWKDKTGKVYSSANRTQDKQAMFIVDQVTRLDVINPDGNPVQKLDIKFSCRLFAEDGTSVLIKDAQGTIGFAYN